MEKVARREREQENRAQHNKELGIRRPGLLTANVAQGAQNALQASDYVQLDEQQPMNNKLC